jgi:hypothetical protein
MDCRVISAFTRVFDALCPAMTGAVLRIAPRADGSHVRVAVFIVNNRPETMERIGPHVKVGSSHDAAAGRGAPFTRIFDARWRSGALQTPISGLPEIGAHMRASRASPTCVDRYGPWRSRISDAALASARAASHPGHVTAPLASQSHDVKQPYSTQRRTARRLKSLHRRAAQWGATATRPAQ